MCSCCWCSLTSKILWRNFRCLIIRCLAFYISGQCHFARRWHFLDAKPMPVEDCWEYFDLLWRYGLFNCPWIIYGTAWLKIIQSGNMRRPYAWYMVWLWSSRNHFIASVPVYLQLLRGVTFEILPVSSYSLNPTMLSLLETFLELWWNSFQCHHHIFLDVFSILKYLSL